MRSLIVKKGDPFPCPIGTVFDGRSINHFIGSSEHAGFPDSDVVLQLPDEGKLVPDFAFLFFFDKIHDFRYR